jgi:molybdate/tungstate transport system ATP-binding protein
MLSIRGVEKAYDGFSFGPVDLDVGEEVCCVLGPSGSGKTTLLSLVAGIVAPDGGSVTLDGRSLVGRPVEDRRTGLVFQDGALFPHMTARENVAYAARDPGRVDELASLLAVADVLDRRPAALSGGERQRVALARTLAADPDAVLLDEPLSSLDAPIRRRLRHDLRALFDDLDVPVVYVTHDQRTAAALGDRIAVFRDGQIAQVGAPADVLDRPESRFVARFTGTENVFEATASDSVLRVGDVSIRTGEGDLPPGTVTACVRPSRVDLHPGGVDREARVDGDGAAAADADPNVLAGTVERWLNEGAEYRVVVALDAAPLSLVAAVRPGAFERLPTDPGSPVRVTVSPSAVHVIG